MKTADQWRHHIARLTRNHPHLPWQQAFLLSLCQDLEQCQTALAWEQEQRRLCDAIHPRGPGKDAL